jgi:hypothetical protein
MWRIGIEYERFGGFIPTATYFRENLNSKESYTRYGLGVRSRRFLDGRMRAIYKFITLSHAFDTENSDENLLTTKIDSAGLGIQVEYEFNHFLWLGRQSTWSFAVQDIYALAYLYPSMAVRDVNVVRGSSATGKGIDYRLGINIIMYTRFVPGFKRWFLNIQLGQTSYDMRFSGGTKNDKSSPYKIPEGGTSTESRSYGMISFGYRFDDFLGKFFKPK